MSLLFLPEKELNTIGEMKENRYRLLCTVVQHFISLLASLSQHARVCHMFRVTETYRPTRSPEVKEFANRAVMNTVRRRRISCNFRRCLLTYRLKGGPYNKLAWKELWSLKDSEWITSGRGRGRIN